MSWNDSTFKFYASDKEKGRLQEIAATEPQQLAKLNVLLETGIRKMWD